MNLEQIIIVIDEQIESLKDELHKGVTNGRAREVLEMMNKLAKAKGFLLDTEGKLGILLLEDIEIKTS